MHKTRLFMIIAVVLISLLITFTVLADNTGGNPVPSGNTVQDEVTVSPDSALIEGNEIEAVSVQYAFSSSPGTYTEIISGTVHGDASNDDTSFNAIDLGFTFHFNNVDYTQVSIQSNGFIAMGASVSSSYYPLSTGSSNNVVAALGRDIEGNDTTSVLMSKMEGTAPNRVFTVQWSHYRRYGSTYTGDDFNFQIKLYETSNLVELVYGPFAFHNATELFVQVGLRGDTNEDYNNRTTTTDWTASVAGTSNSDSMSLSPTVYPPTGLIYDWTPVVGAFLSPATQSGGICKGSDVVYDLTLTNATGMDSAFDLSYTSIWPYGGPIVSPVIPDGSSWDFQVTVHIPWSANAGDIDTLTVTATGGGYTDNAQLITAASELSNWADYSDAPRPVRAPSIVYKDGKLYKIGGYDGAARAYLDIYDIATDTWTAGADMPGSRYWIDCEAIGDGIYCAGGYLTSGQTSLYRYDIPTNAWTTLTAMSAYRYSYASVTLNGKYYVIGGYSGSYSATLWEYDPATDTWNYGLPSMVTGRRYHSAGVIGGKIYVAGGYSPSYLNSVEIYDPVANSWSPGPSMPTSWLNAADSVLNDRYLILAGGDDNSTGAASNLVWILDAQTGIWSAGPNLVHSLYGAEGDSDGSGIWVVTGRLYDGAYSYSPYTSKLSPCDVTCTPVSGLDFTWDPLVPYANFPVTFDASYAAGSPSIGFDWVFGDGETGQGQSTVHTYLVDNTYTVGLTATNCDGANTATTTHDVTVILPPTISINPTSLSSSQYTDTLVTQTLEICNVGDDPLTWEIEETDGTLQSGALNKPSTIETVVPEDIIRLEDDSVDCAAYENYAGYEPAEVAAACPVALPPGVAGNPQAPTDIGYAQDIGYISDNFVTFTLNNFAGQTIVGTNPNAYYGMDFDLAAQVLYALNDTTDELGTIDLTTGAFTGLVSAPPGGGAANWTGLSIDPSTDVFYASTATDLYILDPVTGVSTLVGPFGTTLMIDIAVNMNGEMYGHDIGTDSIYSINMTTGVATLIGPTGQNANYAQGMDFDNDDGTLYIFLYIGSGANVYGTVDLTTGTVIPISNTPQGEFEGAVQIPGVAFDLPWLSETPITGTLSGGTCENVSVTFDSTGLALGTYTGGLDVNSNDPVTPVVPVPVTLDVIGQTFPDIDVTPTQLSDTLFPDEQATHQLNICNTGNGALDWTLEEGAPPLSPQAVLYDNGPLVTHPAACSSMDASRLQTNLGMNTLGFGHQFDLGYRMADDFVISDPQGWQIDQITFFAYQTGAPVSPSPINGVYYQIWNGPPNDPSSSVVFGDLTTNRLLSSTNPNLQRDSGTSPCANNRYIFADVASAGMILPAGTYWIEWATDGNLTSGPWAPPITIAGQVTTGNAMQYTTAWAPANDSGTLTQQGLPFIIEGSIVGGYNIPWLSENPTSGTVPPAACTVVDVTFDSTGMAGGVYNGVLLVNSNDPDEPIVPVDVTLTVIEGEPDITLTPDAITGNALPGEVITQPLAIGNIGNLDLTWSLYDGTPSQAWSDNFDSYATGSQMHGQGGWKGWGNDPAAGALTTDVQFRSAPNSVAIVNVSDLVHEYSGITSGSWTYTAWQFIPTDATDIRYFILLNQYDDAGLTNNWSVQVEFDPTTNTVNNTGSSGGSVALVKGSWVELRVEINLTADTTSFYYNNQLLYTGTWTNEVSGGGIANIAAVDLWGNYASVSYYDDISLVPAFDPPCGVWGDVPWLSTMPTSGTTPPAGSSDVSVFLDAAGLSAGVYTADLCVESNDPDEGLIPVPVTFTVVEPEADLSLEKSGSPSAVVVGETIEYTLSVTNLGPHTAADVTLVDTLPALVEFTSASPQCSEAAGVVTCDLGDIDMGAVVNVTIVVTALDVGAAVNEAEVSSTTSDPDMTNNSDAVTTMIAPAIYNFYLPLVQKN